MALSDHDITSAFNSRRVQQRALELISNANSSNPDDDAKELRGDALVKILEWQKEENLDGFDIQELLMAAMADCQERKTGQNTVRMNNSALSSSVSTLTLAEKLRRSVPPHHRAAWDDFQALTNGQDSSFTM